MSFLFVTFTGSRCIGIANRKSRIGYGRRRELRRERKAIERDGIARTRKEKRKRDREG